MASGADGDGCPVVDFDGKKEVDDRGVGIGTAGL